MSKLIDMTGWKMSEHGVPDSYLTVISRAENNKKGQAMWNCQCQCGKMITVLGISLRSGNTKSCGCAKKNKTSEIMKEFHEENRQKNIIGHKFGKLTVIKSLNKLSSTGHMIYLCQCECGNFCERVGTNLKTQYYIPSCGCNYFSSHTKISTILTQNNIKYETEKMFDDCIFQDTGKKARFDFYLPDYNYIIEYDGEQHFEPRRFSNNCSDEEALIRFHKIQEHDNIKNEYCKNHNIPLIRIPYTHFSKITINDLLLETSSFIL